MLQRTVHIVILIILHYHVISKHLVQAIHWSGYWVKAKYSNIDIALDFFKNCLSALEQHPT